jgi:hypothetical protein
MERLLEVHRKQEEERRKIIVSERRDAEKG